MIDPTRTASPPAGGVTASVADAGITTAPGSSAGPPVPVAPGTRYVLGEEIARGGMGEVYRATDTVLGREVAVKVLQAKYGPASAAARRFADEARITGQLQHPNIPAVHDLGTLPDGRPFLAMKLIKGDTLDQLLKDRADLAADRGRFIAAFELVCQAVAYAHAHNVLHRDLKPANVMVGAFGEVQVMDWGLAKVLRDSGGEDSDPESTSAETEIKSLRDSAELTQAGSVLGTPAFMPPEQAAGAVSSIDARSDVFGLGAILAVILTGRPPFVSTSAETTRVKAAQGDVADCFGKLDGCGAEPDLVVLCKRCLSPKQADRPADAGVVAGEVASLRAAADERARVAERKRAEAAVRAAEERKRRRVVLTAAVALVLVLATGGAVAVWQAVRATAAETDTARQLGLTRQAEETARTERDNARSAEGRATEAAELARRRETEAKAAEAKAVEREQRERVARLAESKARQVAEEVAVFMKVVFTQGSADGQASPTRSANPKLTVKEAMDHATTILRGQFRNRPEVEAAVRAVIGNTYRELGTYPEAEAQLGRSLAVYEELLGPDAPPTLAAANNLGLSYEGRGDYAAAQRLYERALAGNEKALGPDDAETLTCASNVGRIHLACGRTAAAEPLFKRALAGREKALGPDHRETLTSINNLAYLYQKQGRPAIAQRLYELALAGYEKTLGPDHPATLSAANNLADTLLVRDRPAAAQPLFERALAGREKALGPDHPTTLSSVNSLAVLHWTLRRYDLAEPLFKRALAGREKALGPDHPHTLASAYEMAFLHMSRGEHAAAQRLHERALAGREKALGPDHPDTLSSATELARVYQTLRRYDPAEPLFKRAAAGREKALGPDHQETAASLNDLAIFLQLRGRYDDAEPLYERAYAGYVTALGADDPNTRTSAANLARIYHLRRRYADAEPLFKKALAGQEKASGKSHPDTLAAAGELARLHLDMNRFAEAVPLFRRVADGNGRPADAFTALTNRSYLGLALLGDGQAADAEPYLLAGYAGLKSQEKTLQTANRALLRMVAEGLVALYERAGRPADVTAWRENVAKLPPESAPPPRPAK